MKAHRVCTTHREDRTMIALFEKGLTDITNKDSTFILDFATAQQLCRKFSTIAMRTKYNRILLKFTDSTSDEHGINNYLPAMTAIIMQAKIDLCLKEKDSNQNKQLHENKNANKQVNGEEARDDKTKEKPINQNVTEYLPFNYDGKLTNVSDKHTRTSTITGTSQGSKDTHQGKRYHHIKCKSPRLPSGSHQPSEHVQSLQTHQGPPRESPATRGQGKIYKEANNRFCMVCEKRGHNNLIHCPKFPSYMPGGTNVLPVPEVVCHQCLSTAGQPSSCTHWFPRDFGQWQCKASKVHFALCRNCPKHQELQKLLKANFNHELGLMNLTNVWQHFYISALINSIQVHQNQQSPGFADTKALNTGNTLHTSNELVNQLQVGNTCTPFEVIQVQTNTGSQPIVLVYDTGAQVTLCNQETRPLSIQSRQTHSLVTISTISSSTAKPREIHTLQLGNGDIIDAILSPHLKLTLRAADIPDEWKGQVNTFADQDNSNVKAQILVGADQAKLFPITVTNPAGQPIETDVCRLMRSRITNKLIIFGACKEQRDKMVRGSAKAIIRGTEVTNASSITQNLAISSPNPVEVTKIIQ